jgi:hypothetical protein
MKRVILALVAVWVAGSGCATITSGGGGDQTVKVVSDTPGAAVVVDGYPVGAAPVEVKLKRKRTHTVEVQAPGYETTIFAVNSEFNPWVIGNVVFGGLIGIVVDLSTGATSTLSPDKLTVNLRPLVSPAATPAPGVSPASATSTSSPSEMR